MEHRYNGGKGMSIMEGQMHLFVAALGAAILSMASFSRAAEERNAEDFMRMHQVEAVFHEAGSTKNIELMLSLFADDAVLTAGGKTHAGKDQVKKFFQTAGPFQPQNEWIGYTPAFRLRYDVQGERAHLFFECLWVDKKAGKIAAHVNSVDSLSRVDGKWLIKEMKLDPVPDL
jgi:ketosteroid isomerase-like protein